MQITTEKKYYPAFLTPWVFSDDFLERLDKIKSRHGIHGEVEVSFNNFIFDAMTAAMDYDEMNVIVRSIFFYNSEETAMFIRGVIGWLLLPVMPFYEYNFIDLLEGNGGRIADFPLPRVMSDILQEMQTRLEDEANELEAKFMLEIVNEEKNSQISQKINDKSDFVTNKEVVEPAVVAEKIKQAYQHILNLSAEEKIKELHALYEKDTDEFTKSFYKYINDRDVDGVAASLWTLAERGQLLGLLAVDRKIATLLSKHLEKKFSLVMADHFNETRDHIGYLAYFLRHLLLDTLKITESDSAALVIHLLNLQAQITGADVDMIAYADASTGVFKWRNIINKNNRLDLE